MMDERTQMIAGVTCPVCAADNGPTAEWCVDCGFRLGTTPGESQTPTGGYRLLAEGEGFALKHGANVVGRLQADVYLSDPSVSRRHAVITVSESSITVRDEGSSNGTRIGKEVLPAGEDREVYPGERIQFGAVFFHLSGADGAPAEAPAEEESETKPAVAAYLKSDEASYPLKHGANSIGRKPANNVVIADPYVSGFHAVLTITDDGATLVDSGSSNGTFISERRLSAGETESLEPGQEIVFGRVALKYLPVTEEEETSADDAG